MKRPLRVAHIMGTMTLGGTASVLMDQLRHIDRERVQFDFLVGEDSTAVPRYDIEALDGQVHTLPAGSRPVAYGRALAALLREKKYDVVHTHDSANAASLAVAQSVEIPVRIAHAHTSAGAGLFSRASFQSVRRGISRSAATHFCADSTQSGQWGFGTSACKKDRVKHLRPGVDIERFAYRPDDRVWLRRAMDLEGRLVIGYVGRFEEQNNLWFLLDIFTELLKKRPDALLLLVGDGELRAAMEETVRERRIRYAVRFLGFRRDVHQLMQAMDMFLLPSLQGGLPLAAVEAQAAGLPVLLSDQLSPETKLTLDCSFHSLKSSPEWWARALALRTMRRRVDRSGEVAAAGFDILSTTADLTAWYEALCQEHWKEHACIQSDLFCMIKQHNTEHIA